MHSSDSSFCVIKYETNLIELNKKNSKASALETKYLRKGYFFLDHCLFVPYNSHSILETSVRVQTICD